MSDITKLRDKLQEEWESGRTPGVRLVDFDLFLLFKVRDLEAKLIDLGGYVSAQTGRRILVSYSDLWDRHAALKTKLEATEREVRRLKIAVAANEHIKQYP